jgi:glycosyltransferase involved in cell wall biosynthesis
LRFKPDVIFTFEVFFTCIPMVVSKFLHLPYIVFVNGDTEDFKIQGMPRFLLFFIDLIRNINFRFSDKIITINETLKKILIDKYNINPRRISIVNNGVDIDVFRPLDKREICNGLGLDSQTLYIGFLGGIFPWHGLDNLIRSASIVSEKHPEVKFIIAGHGPNRENLIRLTEELKIKEKFIFYNSIPFDSVPKYMNIFDIAVLFFVPVRRNMGNPIKLYEYLACGKPIIASNIAGYGKFVEKFRVGIAVDSNNPSSISEAIIRLLEDEELRDRYATNAREVVLNNFTWSHTAERIEEYINEAITK